MSHAIKIAPTRRQIVKGAAAAPLAAVLADPSLTAHAAAGLQTVSTKTKDGRTVSAALARPATDAAPVPSVMLIHEWWGLNDQIKAVASDFARQGYMALAIDLYDGAVAETREKAGSLARSVKDAEGRATTAAWIDWLRADASTTERVGTVGWCFGGGWSLTASQDTPVDATVIYYGNVRREADALGSLKGPVLGHFATQDRFINEDMVSGFKAAMAEAGKPLTVHWYKADHAFANPTSARYDEADAALSWERTTAFFEDHLKG
ncbi:MAG: dienelactone hydrolase family protein [Alphaproteobacteria bacterium]